MGIFRAGVRVARALSQAPSSSSSDDEEVVVQKHKVRKSSDKINEVGVLPCITKDASDHYQVGESTCQLPQELFELSNLGDILSLQSWNECLSEKERQQLSAYLPVMELGSFQKTLGEVFSAHNMYFGSPMEHLWQQLTGGLCNPTVVRTHQTLTALQRREYYHDLRCYHNGMVNSLTEMRELWMSDPDANLEEKLSSWNGWKSSEAARMKGRKACEDRGQTECTTRPVGTSNAGSLISADRGINEELAVHSDLESDQVFDCTITQTTPINFERVQNQIADQAETSSIHKMNLSLRDNALSGGSHVKQKSTSQESFERRSRKRKHMKGNGKEFRAIVSWEYENAYLSKVQNGGYRDSGLNASEMMVRNSSAGIHPNVDKKELDKRISSIDQRGRSQSRVIKLMKSAQSTFVPPLTPGFTFSTLHFLSAETYGFCRRSFPWTV
ncbi:hypothetical protein GOP47_0006280 [Adiantum capillus-veneris]|uniref:DEUBAD domain-containing protein n=1 Tax=Adiantum capillus-veneris TaxID=13818 RepID=A0A9D4ZK91_ADICA|nr:hypothetical protein GOP47_0006280 [Adiantum capillus-veneris]